MSERPALGLGCMRLASVAEADAIATIHAALDAGATLLDTADVYASDEASIGRGEAIVARALATWPGDRASITIATKGGLVRAGGAWRPDGRAKHLFAACEASLRSLARANVDLYFLHAIDPRTPLATSWRALVELRRAGVARAIGLSNVGVEALEEASAIAPIDAVQVRLGPLHDDAVRGGVVAWCRARGVRVLAHTPFGGAKAARRIARDAKLVAIAERLGVTPFEVALAWILELGATPLPGATRPETARSLGRALALTLDDEARAALAVWTPDQARATRTAAHAQEIVLVMGVPGAGKSTFASSLEARGYAKLNRDALGGRLDALDRPLDELLAAGKSVVLDNTYTTRRARSRPLEIATKHGVPARCVWIDASVERAQRGACARLIERLGRLPSPEEIAARAREDPAMLTPRVIFRAIEALEPPRMDEGFASIERVEAAALRDTGARPAILFDAEVLRQSRRGARAPLDPDDVIVPDDRAHVVRARAAEGFVLLATAWLPEVRGTDELARAHAALDRTNELLGVSIAWAVCTHPPGPPICWCRKPLPGLGLELARVHDIDLAASVVIGRGPADRGFAARLGARYEDAGDVFGRAPG